MNWIEVISVGPGAQELLTVDAARAIEEASVIFCAERHEVLINKKEKRRALIPLAEAMEQMDTCIACDQRVAVLVSGDAGLYSMLGMLTHRFGKERLRVHPGVSALQAFCAQLGIAWQDACILSAHGRSLPGSALCHAVRTNGRVLLLLDARHNPQWVKKTLEDGGLAHAKMTVGERLSYADACVAPYEERTYDALCMVMIENTSPQSGLPPIGLMDEAFERGKTPMTKRETRVQIITALQLTPGAVVWDIGAGTGSVTIECARQCPWGEVYAIERDAQALKLIERNVRRFQLLNVHVIKGSAPRALEGLRAPTHVFLGGTGGESAAIMDWLEGLRTPIRLCATAVTMESAHWLTARMSGYEEFTAMQLNASRLEKVGGYTMFRTQNPVFIMTARMGEGT